MVYKTKPILSCLVKGRPANPLGPLPTHVKSTSFSLGVVEALHHSIIKTEPMGDLRHIDFDRINDFRELLQNTDGMEVIDPETQLTLYISPDRARARKDLSLPPPTQSNRKTRCDRATQTDAVSTPLIGPTLAEVPSPLSANPRLDGKAFEEAAELLGRCQTINDSEEEETSPDRTNPEGDGSPRDQDGVGSDAGEAGQSDGDDEMDIEPAEGAAPQAQEYTSQDRIQTSSNRNRKRIQAQEQKRQRRLARERAKQKQQKEGKRAKGKEMEEGPETETRQLDRPRSRSPTDPGSGADESSEDSPSCSDGERQLKADAWLEQAWGTAPRPSPRVQTAMVRNALAVGGPTAMEEWQDLFRYWRNTNSIRTTLEIIDPTGKTDSRAYQGLIARQTHLQGTHVNIRDFYRAWHRLDELRVDTTSKAIIYRIQCAALDDAYHRAFAQIKGKAIRGVTQTAQAKLTLFRMVYPQYWEIPKPKDGSITKTAWRNFNHRLEYAKRWAFLKQELGPGIFMIIPSSIVPHTFVEQTLKYRQLKVWVKLIATVNPGALPMGTAVCQTLEKIQRRQKLSSKRLRLEKVPTADLKGYPNLVSLWEDAPEGMEISADETSRVPSREGPDIELSSSQLESVKAVNPSNFFSDDASDPSMWNTNPQLIYAFHDPAPEHSGVYGLAGLEAENNQS